MSELKRQKRPKKHVVEVIRAFNATGRQVLKGIQELSNEEYEFAIQHRCLRNGV